MTNGIAAQWIAQPTDATIPTQSRQLETLAGASLASRGMLTGL
jgi:hypothetical protein